MTPPPRVAAHPHRTSCGGGVTQIVHRCTPAAWAIWFAVAAAGMLAACNSNHPATPPAATIAASAPAAVTTPRTRAPASRYDLARDERRGGHTLARHVGRSDAELRDRLRRERSISTASTWTDRPTAETTVALALDESSARLARWSALTGRRANLALDWKGTDTIGRSLTRGARAAQSVSCAVVVLRWDDAGGSWYVLTTYPEVCR